VCIIYISHFRKIGQQKKGPTPQLGQHTETKKKSPTKSTLKRRKMWCKIPLNRRRSNKLSKIRKCPWAEKNLANEKATSYYVKFSSDISINSDTDNDG
jgi:hypothetical protein